MVLREVDRQVCYEISERFTLAPSPDGAPRIRTAVVRIDPTGPEGSAVAAVANAFIPGPGTVRVPGTTGGPEDRGQAESQYARASHGSSPGFESTR